MGQDAPVLQHLGRALQRQMSSTVEEPLPKRWVELILYLDEKERRAGDEPKDGASSAP